MDLAKITQIADAVATAHAQLEGARTIQVTAEAAMADLECFGERIAALCGKLALAEEAQARVRALDARAAVLQTVLGSLQHEIEKSEALRDAVNREFPERERQLAELEKSIQVRQAVLDVMNADLEGVGNFVDKMKKITAH
jgi:chromosome segregation ATPase